MARYSIINFKVILLYGMQQSVPDAGKDLCRDILTGPLFFPDVSLAFFGCFCFFCRFLRVSASFFLLLCSSIFFGFLIF